MSNPVEGRRWHRAAVAICCGIALGGCADRPEYVSDTLAANGAQPARDVAAENDLGIRMEGLRLSAAGDMLDLRYRVLDRARAAPLLDGKTMPYLLDEASGAQLGAPDAANPGSIRFANPGRLVRTGNRMTLVVGERRIGNLTVE